MIDIRITSIERGILAGFAATMLLSLLMLAKKAMGLMPGLDIIAMLSTVVGASAPVVGWTIHFMIGSIVWGALFAMLFHMLPGPPWRRGVDFSIGGWFAMMLLFMPVAGIGPFGRDLGIVVPVVTLALHLVYGLLLGSVYGGLIRTWPQRLRRGSGWIAFR